MLVLSRKEKQRIVFPNLDIAVEILKVAGQTVRVGIEAPHDVQILRAELVEEKERRTVYDEKRRQDSTSRHAFRNRLNSATMALSLLQKQIEVGQLDGAETTLRHALAALDELNAGHEPDNSPVKEPRSNGKLALVVEDNDNERELMAGFLRLSGYHVAAVEDGLAAMNYLAEEQTPDVVLLDINMPRMDGQEAVKAIRRDPRHRGLKLFAVTGTDRSSCSIGLGKDGVDRWFTKPLKPAEFVSALDDELARA